jgi:outer membrane immunogenic protein
MKNLILASTLLLSITGLAQAADMPLKAVPLAPVFTWTGLYLGADAGYGWNSASGSSFCTTPGGVVNGFGCSAPGSETLNLKGGFVGGQVGYNLQTGLFVWGIEADIQVSGINQTATTSVPCCNAAFAGPPGSLSISDRLEWFGTVRGRLGLAIWDHTLLYGTGGVIYGEEYLSQTKTFPVTTYSGINTPIHTGWIGGVGVEYAFTNNISAKLEGLFYDMGSQTRVVSTAPLSGFTTTGTFSSNNGAMVRLGANLKFGP